MTDQYECPKCGSVIVDLARHHLWHQALADVWRWVERVSGSSCEQARNILGDAT